MNLARYDKDVPNQAKVKQAIHKAKLLLETLEQVERGEVQARHVLVDMARTEQYEGPVIRFRLDDLFDEADYADDAARLNVTRPAR